MDITNTPPEWDGADSVNLRQFLGTPTGTRLLAKIQEVVPSLLGKGDTNEVLIRNGEVRGCALLLTQFFSMANPPPDAAKVPSEYPALTDDNAWDDGQQLTPQS